MRLKEISRNDLQEHKFKLCSKVFIHIFLRYKREKLLLSRRYTQISMIHKN